MPWKTTARKECPHRGGMPCSMSHGSGEIAAEIGWGGSRKKKREFKGKDSSTINGRKGNRGPKRWGGDLQYL